VGGGELSEKLQLLSKELSLLNKVTFFGRASDDELDQIQKISDIFVCPSLFCVFYRDFHNTYALTTKR